MTSTWSQSTAELERVLKKATSRRAYGLDHLPKPDEMTEIAEPWRPFRSAGSWYLWRLSDILTL